MKFYNPKTQEMKTAKELLAEYRKTTFWNIYINAETNEPVLFKQYSEDRFTMYSFENVFPGWLPVKEPVISKSETTEPINPKPERDGNNEREYTEIHYDYYDDYLTQCPYDILNHSEEIRMVGGPECKKCIHCLGQIPNEEIVKCSYKESEGNDGKES